MSSTSLHDFASRIIAHDRILFGDLKRLQRDILPDRVTSREEAEILLFLDSAVHRTDREWTPYLTATVRDFAIWGLHPAGSLDRGKAEWLAAALAGADPTRTARAILREIVQGAPSIDEEALLELEMCKRNFHGGSAVRRQHMTGVENEPWDAIDGGAAGFTRSCRISESRQAGGDACGIGAGQGSAA
jgi:hypothetical protein